MARENLWVGEVGTEIGQLLNGHVCSVTTLAGAQQELLHMKLQTIHQLLQDSKPNKGVEVPEPGTGLGGDSLLEVETKPLKLEHA